MQIANKLESHIQDAKTLYKRFQDNPKQVIDQHENTPVNPEKPVFRNRHLNNSISDIQIHRWKKHSIGSNVENNKNVPLNLKGEEKIGSINNDSVIKSVKQTKSGDDISENNTSKQREKKSHVTYTEIPKSNAKKIDRTKNDESDQVSDELQLLDLSHTMKSNALAFQETLLQDKIRMAATKEIQEKLVGNTKSGVDAAKALARWGSFWQPFLHLIMAVVGAIVFLMTLWIIIFIPG